MSSRLWMTRRGEKRRKAKFLIAERVSSAAAVPINNDKPAAAVVVVSNDEERRESLFYSYQDARPFILHVVDGNRSFFSSPCLDQHHKLLSTPFPVEYLFEEQSDVWQHSSCDAADGPSTEHNIGATSAADTSETRRLLIGDVKIRSFLGIERYREFITELLTTHTTCTFIEFAVWIRRYSIVATFIVGGINPCVRGTRRTTLPPATDNIISRDGNALLIPTDTSEHCWESEVHSAGARAVQVFFDCHVPLSLSAYIIKRVVEMRNVFWEFILSTNGQDDNAQMSCVICRRHAPIQVLLCFGPDSCQHIFCESCFWKNLLDELHDRSGDVVLCPVCDGEPATRERQENKLDTTAVHDREISPLSRCEESRRKFHDLPANAKELKKSARKKTKVSERTFLCATWAKAVIPLVGRSRDVRLDKFFYYSEKGAVHYVRGCLEAGVDVHHRNEYGQTALFLSAWRGHVAVVQLLLAYGGDPSLCAHGGVSVMGVARAQGHRAIVDVLCSNGASSGPVDERQIDWSGLVNNQLEPTLNDSTYSSTILIEHEANHPGAGSLIIDCAFPQTFIDNLVHLHDDLPVEMETKKKPGPCSVRSYFCDAEMHISTLLTKAISCTSLRGPNGTITVLPHMRYLCYNEPGAVLAPHVDLCRVDYMGKRSTHTFILYLTDCLQGGETTLLGCLAGEGRNQIKARVQPRRGRLLVFPHHCPHEGLSVFDVPKLLLRGELRVNASS